MSARVFVISDMMRVSLAQFLLVGLVTFCCAVFVGLNGALSALFGGGAYALASTLLALFLVLAARKSTGPVNPYWLLVGEFVKIAFVLLALGLTVAYYESLHWPSLLISIIAAVNAYFIVLFKRN